MPKYLNFLPHYYNLLNNKDYTYCLLIKQIPAKWSEDASLDDLWVLHNKKFLEFQKLLKSNLSKLNYKSPENSNGETLNTSYLDLKIKIAQEILKSCEFCENRCLINRTIYGSSKNLRRLGKCGIDEETIVSSAFLHYGEEPPLVPSGTIFFAGCTFDCVFCQNWDISTYGKAKSHFPGQIYQSYFADSQGTPVNANLLAILADNLALQGAKNINYVGGDPTPNLHTIIESLKYQKSNKCQLWNSNFYNSISALKLLTDIMDFWLPDFKYGNNLCAEKYSGIKNYYDVVTRNLKIIYNWGSRDIIIRHLVMPGHFECCTKQILLWIGKNLPGIPVNIMGQYRPEHIVNEKIFPEINRRVTREEMTKSFALADELGIEYKFVK